MCLLSEAFNLYNTELFEILKFVPLMGLLWGLILKHSMETLWITLPLQLFTETVCLHNSLKNIFHINILLRQAFNFFVETDPCA